MILNFSNSTNYTEEPKFSNEYMSISIEDLFRACYQGDNYRTYYLGDILHTITCFEPKKRKRSSRTTSKLKDKSYAFIYTQPDTAKYFLTFSFINKVTDTEGVEIFNKLSMLLHNCLFNRAMLVNNLTGL